jgi:hypothetical protein
MALALSGLAALVVGLALFACRNDDAFARLWSKLVSPEADTFRRTLHLQLEVERCRWVDCRERAARATTAGTPLEAARLEELAEASCKQHSALVILLRMLRAAKIRQP